MATNRDLHHIDEDGFGINNLGDRIFWENSEGTRATMTGDQYAWTNYDGVLVDYNGEPISAD